MARGVCIFALVGNFLPQPQRHAGMGEWWLWVIAPGWVCVLIIKSLLSPGNLSGACPAFVQCSGLRWWTGKRWMGFHGTWYCLTSYNKMSDHVQGKTEKFELPAQLRKRDEWSSKTPQGVNRGMIAKKYKPLNDLEKKFPSWSELKLLIRSEAETWPLNSWWTTPGRKWSRHTQTVDAGFPWGMNQIRMFQCLNANVDNVFYYDCCVNRSRYSKEPRGSFSLPQVHTLTLPVRGSWRAADDTRERIFVLAVIDLDFIYWTESGFPLLWKQNTPGSVNDLWVMTLMIKAAKPTNAQSVDDDIAFRVRR